MPESTPHRPRGSTRGRPSAAAVVVTGVAGVLAGVLVFAVVANLMRASTPRQRESARFVVGPARERARTVAEGGPLLFQDLLGGSRDVYVQHLGGSDWRTFEARPPGAPRRCQLRWNRATRTFADPCGGRDYPADGSGLTSFPTRVDDEGRVVVDLRRPLPPAPSG